MHWLVQGADSANHVQKQTTRYPYMVTRQRKTGHVNIVNVFCTPTETLVQRTNDANKMGQAFF